MDKVSIITPAFNCANTIQKTFDSVLSQTYSCWEWIIVDDCSTDNSYEIISDFAKIDHRIIVFRMDNNSGTATARNLGLKKSSGRYITFLDSDDMIDQSYLEDQLYFLQNNGPIVSAGYRRITSKSCTNFFVPNVVTYKSLLKGNPLSCLTTMYDKEVIGEVFFPENIKKPEDYVFWLNILKKGYIARGNPKVLATYVMHKGSKSSNKFKLIKHMYYVYHHNQGYSILRSCYYIICWALYGLKKYSNVRK